MISTQICRLCKEEKPVDKFYKYKRTEKLYRACRACHYARSLKWRAANPEKYRAGLKKYGTGWTAELRQKHAPSEREKHDGYLYRNYGITLAQYDEMLNAQGGVCAICKDECNRKTTKRLCVDHDHFSGVVRGLLCFQCNVGIGKFKDKPATLLSAISYLERHSAAIIKCEAA